MKITRLKKGYRLDMSDEEFDLYRMALDEGFEGLAVTECNDFYNKLVLLDRIPGAASISDWFVVADDRRST
jgi:hypothetical protein|tara:strand:- start:45 stop:257 length:213 start_codon:yes stop_codon:yes gene_type:complete